MWEWHGVVQRIVVCGRRKYRNERGYTAEEEETLDAAAGQCRVEWEQLLKPWWAYLLGELAGKCAILVLAGGSAQMIRRVEGVAVGEWWVVGGGERGNE